jgi:hypothetical protein
MLLCFMGLGVLAVWCSYRMAGAVASWFLFVLGVGILATCILTLIVVGTDIRRARDLASSWRRDGSLTRTGESEPAAGSAGVNARSG